MNNQASVAPDSWPLPYCERRWLLIYLHLFPGCFQVGSDRMVIKRPESGARLPSFASWFQPLTSCVDLKEITSLCLSLFICKIKGIAGTQLIGGF